MKKQKPTLSRILSLLVPYRKYLILSAVSAALTTAGQLLIPIFAGKAIDAMIGVGRVDFGVIRVQGVWIVCAALIAAASYQMMSVCANRAAYRVSRDLRNAAMEKIGRLPLSFLDQHASGDLMARTVADVDLFTDGLLLSFTQLISGLLTIAGTLIFMLAVDVPIALVVVCVTPLSLVAAAVIARLSFRYFREQTRTRGDETAYVNERIEGMKVVQAFGRESDSVAEFDALNASLAKASFSAVFYSSITNPSTRFVNSVVYAGVGLFGALRALAGGISIGELSIFLTYANQYTKPFNDISGVITELQNAVACAGRLFELLDTPEEEPDAPGAEVLRTEDIDGRVRFEDVSFSYTPGRELIRDLNLDVKRGERIAIVGPTGSGKTTLINLLMRFYDVDAGRIEVSGHTLRDLTRDSLRAGFGMVLQETWLFSGTVAENIAYGRPDASREEIVAAAKRARAHGFIERLPEGYDTVLTGGGGALSQGEKQLLSIARVMLVMPPMLILDEATSSIDTVTEKRIQQAFDEMMAGRTSFIVAHRLSTIREADCILVLIAGRIEEMGTHEELMEKDGFYAHLVRAQFEGIAI